MSRAEVLRGYKRLSEADKLLVIMSALSDIDDPGIIERESWEACVGTIESILVDQVGFMLVEAEMESIEKGL